MTATKSQHTSATSRAWLEINLDAVRRNAERLQAAAGLPIVAMIKADGYGTGALEVARALGVAIDDSPALANAPWALGIALVAEGVQLRRAGIGGRIICFTPVLDEQLEEMRNEQITPTLHTVEGVTRWRALSSEPWHLAIDTGMNRAGVRWDEAHTLQALIATHPPEGVFTHFHSADVNEASRLEQQSRFERALEQLDVDRVCPKVLRHIDNTHGIIARKLNTSASAASSVRYGLARPGIGLYGSPGTLPFAMDAVVGFKTRIVDMHDVPAGDTVSYLALWTAPSTRRIATIAIGHGDGYRRSLTNVGEVIVRGTRCPVVGVVAMDMTMIDVTDVNDASIGDVVTLIGTDGSHTITVDDVAGRCGLSAYEILIGLRLRVPRIYSGGRAP